MTRSATTIALALLCGVAAGCGGGGAGSTDALPEGTVGYEPPATSPPEQSAGDPADSAATLCSNFRETVGGLPTPKGERANAEFEDQVAAAEQTYLDGLKALPVAADQQATLEEFVAAQEKLAGARASTRAEPPVEGSEGSGPAADAAAEAERLGSKLGIAGCAGA